MYSAPKWRVAIVAKRREPMAKTARSPEPTMVGFCDLVGVGTGPVSKKLAVKETSPLKPP
jgi:hypothetical protein